MNTNYKASFRYMKVLTSCMLTALASCILLPSCNDDDDSVDYTKYYKWRDENAQYSRDLVSYIGSYGSNAYFTDSVMSMSEPISFPSCYRVIKAANEDSLRRINRWYTPYYTSTLKTHYTLYDSKDVMRKMPTNAADRNNPAIMDSIFFDSAIKADTIESKQVEFFSDFTCGSVVVGWGDILQRMHIGDNWLICIPWYLGYGQAGSSNIDPYSNLFFRIELVDITRLGDNFSRDN